MEKLEDPKFIKRFQVAIDRFDNKYIDDNNLCSKCHLRPKYVKGLCSRCYRSPNHKKNSSGNKSYYKTRAIIRDLLNSLKNVPCADCGKIYHPCAMDFDHVRGTKEFNLANAGEIRKATQTVIDMVMKEVEKCEVVCANCHRIRTHNRKEYSSVQGIRVSPTL